MGSDFKEIIDKSNWIKKKVVEVADVNQYSLSGKEKIGKIKYIEISEVNKGKVNKLSKIDFSSAPSRARRVVRNNDILISTVRPNLEHYAFLKNVEKKTIASTGFAVITAKDIEPRFLYYVLSSPRYTEYFSTIAAGHTSAYPAMNPDVIEQVEIPFPPLEEQKRIAHILGTLDDKIELNQRMNETLEAMARALFKAWFVDFEPVKAKMNGKPYPLPEEIMSLFSEEFVDSELGLIPKGWEVHQLSELSDVTSGGRPDIRSSDFVTGEFEIPLYGGAGIMSYTDRPNVTQTVILTGRVGTLNQKFLITDHIWASDNTLLIFPKGEKFLHFLYYSLSNIDLNYFNRGSTQPLLTQSDLKKLSILVPTAEIILKFKSIVSANQKKVNSNNKQNISLNLQKEFQLSYFMSN